MKWLRALRAISMVVAGVSFAAGVASAATTVTWSTTTGTNVSPGTTWGNTRTYASNQGGTNPSLTAQAWSSTGGAASGSTSGLGTGNLLETAYLGVYAPNGLGVNNRDGASTSCSAGDCGDQLSSQPEHAVDNQQRYDSVLFTFTDKISLTGITLGYPPSSSTTLDSDLTVLAYIGAGANPTSFAGKQYSDLIAGGEWQFVGNYADVADHGMVANVSTPISSKYWLIGTYIPGLGGTDPDGAGAILKGADYAKIAGLSASYGNKVPEPGTLGLAGVVLAGFLIGRKRKS